MPAIGGRELLVARTRAAGCEGAAPRAQAAGGRAARAAGADAGSARPRQRQARPSRRGGPGPGAGDPRSAPAMRIASDEIETTSALGPRPPRTHPSPIPVRRCQQLADVANPNVASTARLAAVIAGALTLGACVIAIVVHVALAADARTLARGSRSPGSPRVRPSPPRSSSTTCARCSRWPVCCSSPSRRSGARAPPNPGPSTGSLRGSGEVLLAAGIAANVIVVGASLGAYGTRMVLAALPHGPVELGAYALALVAVPPGARPTTPGPPDRRGRRAQRRGARARRDSRDVRERMRADTPPHLPAGRERRTRRRVAARSACRALAPLADGPGAHPASHDGAPSPHRTAVRAPAARSPNPRRRGPARSTSRSVPG